MLGFPATLIHDVTLVTGLWRWLRVRLAVLNNVECLLNIEYATDALSIGAALRGYDLLA
jgi:hypothetical protein